MLKTMGLAQLHLLPIATLYFKTESTTEEAIGPRQKAANGKIVGIPETQSAN